MKHHEVVVDFNRRGVVQLLKRAFTRPQTTSHSEESPDYQIPLRELPR